MCFAGCFSGPAVITLQCSNLHMDGMFHLMTAVSGHHTVCQMHGTAFRIRSLDDGYSCFVTAGAGMLLSLLMSARRESLCLISSQFAAQCWLSQSVWIKPQLGSFELRSFVITLPSDYTSICLYLQKKVYKPIFYCFWYIFAAEKCSKSIKICVCISRERCYTLTVLKCQLIAWRHTRIKHWGRKVFMCSL